MKHAKSKFVLRYNNAPAFYELIEGSLPTKDGQLWKGEMEDGEKMEAAGNSDGDWPTLYWGWSS